MTDPTYAEEGAALLRAARDDNEKRLLFAAAMHSGQREEASRILAEVRAERLRIAEGFIALAAIKAGLPLCHHPLHPEPEQETP